MPQFRRGRAYGLRCVPALHVCGRERGAAWQRGLYSGRVPVRSAREKSHQDHFCKAVADTKITKRVSGKVRIGSYTGKDWDDDAPGALVSQVWTPEQIKAGDAQLKSAIAAAKHLKPKAPL